MLAVVIAWAMLATIITWTLGTSGWVAALLAAVPFVIWMYKRPEDF